MDDFELRWALDTLLAVDLEHADHGRLSDVVSMSSQLQGFLHSFDMKCARRARQLTDAGRSEPADSMLSNKGRRSNKEAKKVADRADVGDSMSDFEDALSKGTVSAGHIGAIAAATRGLDEDLKAAFLKHEEELLQIAATENVDAGRRIPEITVLVDWQTLVKGLHHNSICETEDGVQLPASTVRRLCCEAEVLPAVLGDDGEILDVGRSNRTATRKQRKALRAMYRTCAHPDCTVGFSACRIHHIKWWWKHQGRTDMNNLLPLCEQHHHLVHEGGWGLTMTPDRITTWSRPDGVDAHTASSINRTGEVRTSSSSSNRRVSAA